MIIQQLSTQGTSTPYTVRFDRTNWDIDEDGIYDNWESNGIDINWDGTEDLALLTADVDHKDIYVEIDHMQFHAPRADARNDVIAAFDNAPVSNPDGIDGINLHLELNEEVTHQDTLSFDAGFNSIKTTNFGTVAERGSGNAVNILEAKKRVYHYNLWVHNQPGSTSSGIAELPRNDYMVSLGSFTFDPILFHNVGSRAEQAGTLMHELGHNLDLHHGGGNDVNCKPNYLSIMSYSFQFPNFVSNRPLDYSRSVIAALNENCLSEPNGVGASTPTGLTTVYGRTANPSNPLTRVTGQAFDWSRDGDFTDTGVGQSINKLGISDCSGTALTTLAGFNDWANLLLPFTSTAGYADGADREIADNEITMETVREIRLANIQTIDYLLQSTPESVFRNPAEASIIKTNLTSTLIESSDSAAAAVRNDDIPAVIAKLEQLRTLFDSSVGGKAEDDIIVDSKSQGVILEQLDNIIGTFKQALP